jgi:segregation and condensation protein A
MYVVSLKQFDGPLDLLLTLISRAKIDIRDIFLSQITEQYLESMAGTDELDMDSASEFLQMAAMLLEIKSRTLLPVPPRVEEEDEETPEEALIRRLTEYKAFRELGKAMQKLECEARECLTKLPEEYPLPPATYELTGLTLDALTQAFARVMSRLDARDDARRAITHEIRRDEYTMHSCMRRIKKHVARGNVRFSQLFEDAPGRVEMVSVFLALLEMLRLGAIRVRQSSIYGEISLAAA